MTELVVSATRALQQAADRVYPNRWRLLVLLIVMITLAIPGPTGNAVREASVGALSDAFLAVTVFVAATLALVFAVERLFSFDLGVVMARNVRWQPVIAALLGVLPGCGGAIIVVTQFTRGYASFGAFIAVLISTMGDAAFVLLAREPATAALVFAISLVAGSVTGMIVDRFHGREFLAVARNERDPGPVDEIPHSTHHHDAKPNWLEAVWIASIAVGLVFGAQMAFLVDVEAYFGAYAASEPVLWFGFAGALLCLIMWATSEDAHSRIGADTRPTDPIVMRVIKDTNFVTSWVVLAFLAYEIGVLVLGVDVDAAFGSIVWLTPLIAILVGFIPGCGPQIVVTTIYLSGAIPFSALMANAIANDGDALFPALALAPKAAVIATLYSAIPALLIGYVLLGLGY